MQCIVCHASTLRGKYTKSGVLIDQCETCRGVWLDRGEIYLFSRNPRELQQLLADGLTDRKETEHRCPRCDGSLESGRFLSTEVHIEQCSQCSGLWFDGGELEKAIAIDRRLFHVDVDSKSRGEQDTISELESAGIAKDEKTAERLQSLAAGAAALPNLALRSAGLLFVLYGLLGAVLIAAVELGALGLESAVVSGIVIVLLQYLLAPWFLDLSLRWVYKFSWVKPEQLPPHLRQFVDRVAQEQSIRFPHFGLIHDGAPNAFTYGHHPNNMRIVISQGLFDVLQAEEVEAVVAHEMGHGKHWDMALMTIAQLVPLLFYYIYRIVIRLKSRGKDDKSAPVRLAIAVLAYVLYILSEYLVLWFSRTREYHADRFAGRVTGAPNRLASALVKIGYGLAARGKPAKDRNEDDTKQGGEIDAIGALGIFDPAAARDLVVSASAGTTGEVGRENLLGAMQWDLWNPWAAWYELHSTHPLIAKRLQRLSEQSASMGQEPYVLFDRRKPESYWDEFFVDLFMMWLPGICMLTAAVLWLVFLPNDVTGGAVRFRWWSAWLIGLGVGSLLKTLYIYRGSFFPELNIAALLHKVKVSGVRPVPVTLEGKIIGRGIPGLIWSEDFVMSDESGILFLDYRQPLRIWEWLFGLLKAGSLAGQKVTVTGWFRRSPVPYLEIKTLQTEQATRGCYARHAKYMFAGFLIVAGVALAIVDSLGLLA